MQILVNEKLLEFPNHYSLFQVRDTVAPNADLIICNGTTCACNQTLDGTERIVLIQRGIQPNVDELEALLLARHTPEVHQPLKNATVGIAGAGGLGSAIAIALMRCGVGHLIIADYDIVEPSNLNRQHYFLDQIGQPKVTALSETLRRINPFNSLQCENVTLDCDNIPPLFSEVDVMVEAFDCPEAKAMISQCWLRTFPHKPLVAASGMAGYGPSNSITTRRALGNLYICGDGTTAVQPGTGLMAPRVGIAAHHQANTVIRLLLGIDPIEEN
jgi:sulfur carrier protein ThiS adenylyltransferase